MEQRTTTSDPVYRRREAAAYLGMSVGALAQLAYHGRGPRYAKPTPRRVYYRRSDLDAWLDGLDTTPSQRSAR